FLPSPRPRRAPLSFPTRRSSDLAGILTRDRRGRVLRARPIDFARIKEALIAAAAYPVRVAFEERPGLPWEPHLTMMPRPYQEDRSEEHTSELQSLTNLVCRLLLE